MPVSSVSADRSDPSKLNYRLPVAAEIKPVSKKGSNPSSGLGWRDSNRLVWLRTYLVGLQSANMHEELLYIFDWDYPYDCLISL